MCYGLWNYFFPYFFLFWLPIFLSSKSASLRKCVYIKTIRNPNFSVVESKYVEFFYQTSLHEFYASWLEIRETDDFGWRHSNKLISFRLKINPDDNNHSTILGLFVAKHWLLTNTKGGPLNGHKRLIVRNPHTTLKSKPNKKQQQTKDKNQMNKAKLT